MQPRTPKRPPIRAVRREIIPEPARRPRRQNRGWAGLGLFLLLAGLAGGGWLLWQARPVGSGEPVTAAVRFGRVQASVEADALIVRRERVERAPQAGEVRRLTAEGARVRVSTPVVEIGTGGSALPPPAPPPAQPPAPSLAPAGRPAAQREYDRLATEIYRTAVQLSQARYVGESIAAHQERLDQLARQQAALLPQLTRPSAQPEPEPAAPATGGAEPQPVAIPSGDAIPVVAAVAGVVLYQADGLEELVTPEAVAQWRPSSLPTLPYPDLKEAALGAVSAGSPLFKLVDDLAIEAVLVVPGRSLSAAQRTALAEQGVLLRVAGRERPLTGRLLRMAEEGEQLLLHLSLPLPSAEALRVRRIRLSLLLEEFEGVVVPRSAIDVREGQTGVWVERGNRYRFTPVRVIGGNQQEVAVTGEFAPDARVLRTLPPPARAVLPH